MDKFLYVAMSGAKETLRAQTANSHNLANASTNGFRADLSAFQARADVECEGTVRMRTRVSRRSRSISAPACVKASSVATRIHSQFG